MEQNDQNKLILNQQETPADDKNENTINGNEEDNDIFHNIINSVISDALDYGTIEDDINLDDEDIESDINDLDEPDGYDTFYDCDTDGERDDFTLKDQYIDDREHPELELEYVYEPGINLAAMEFARNLVEIRQPLGHCDGCRCGEESNPGHCSRCHCSQESDLELAAQLGKTLLASNKDLEDSIKHKQSVIEDQAQEILFLQKQAMTLKEVNNNQLRIHEQLEISIAELEKMNKSLAEEAISDKQRIKTLISTVGILEIKCEKLHLRLNKIKERAKKRKSWDYQPSTDDQPTRTIDRLSSSSDHEEENLHRLQVSNEFWDRTYEESRRKSSFRGCEDTQVPSCLRTSDTAPRDKIGHLEKSHNNNNEDENMNIWRKTSDDTQQARMAYSLLCDSLDTLSGEISWLKEETVGGDERISQLEARVKVLLVENCRLLDQLESSGVSEDFPSVSSSTFEQEVVALQEMLCSRCLTRIDGLCWRQIQRRFALWCIKTWSGSPSWLNSWFILVVFCTFVGAIVNFIVTTFKSIIFDF